MSAMMTLSSATAQVPFFQIPSAQERTRHQQSREPFWTRQVPSSPVLLLALDPMSDLPRTRTRREILTEILVPRILQHPNRVSRISWRSPRNSYSDGIGTLPSWQR